MNKMNKKFIIWQIIILALIGIGIWKDIKPLAILFGVLEIIVLYAKFRKKEENQYCLPASLAKPMKTISLQTIYEGDILAKFMMMIGMVLTMGYTIFFTNQSWWLKGFLIFDMIAGLGLFFFALTTSFQQYNSYLNTIKALQSTDYVKGGQK